MVFKIKQLSIVKIKYLRLLSDVQIPENSLVIEILVLSRPGVFKENKK